MLNALWEHVEKKNGIVCFNMFPKRVEHVEKHDVKWELCVGCWAHYRAWTTPEMHSFLFGVVTHWCVSCVVTTSRSHTDILYRDRIFPSTGMSSEFC